MDDEPLSGGKAAGEQKSCLANAAPDLPTALEYLQVLRTQTPDPLTWDWEATLERSYRRFLQPGARIIDVGGHSGRHARVFLDEIHASRVWVLEPLPREYAYLRHLFAERPEATLINAAASDHPGRARFVVNTHAPEESGLRRRHYNDEAHAVTEEIEVEVTTLDELTAGAQMHGRVDFVKIDVEGAELDVLAGARGLAARDRPIFSVEFGAAAYSVYGHHAGDLFSLASTWSYVLTDLLGHPFLALEDWMAGVDAYYWDYLMMPAERLESIGARLADDPWPVRHR